MRSLRTQLVLISTLTTGVALVGFGALSWYFLEKAERDSVDLELRGIASRYMRELHPRVNLNTVRRQTDDLYGDRIEEGEMVLVVRDEWGDNEVFNSLEASGQLASSLPEDFPPQAPVDRERPEWGFMKGGPKGGKGEGVPPPPEAGQPKGGPKGETKGPGGGPEDQIMDFASVTAADAKWRLISSHERGYSVLAGLDLDKTGASLSAVRKLILFGVPLALVVIALGGWLVAERALRPIRKITATTAKISARDLSDRIREHPRTDPEIAKLVTVLNGMMDRLESGFSHASRFSSDVSHELKTPISVIQAEIETGLRECEPGTPEENRLLVLREETDRLKSITRSLMLLSQADAGELIRKAEVVNLSHELEALADDAEILAESVDVRIESEIESGAEIKGDAVLLRQALLNLINNAIKYNEKDGFVNISLKRESGYIRIAIENTGPGIPGDDRCRVFDRFYRADPSRTRGVGGFGLGLSLARAVIEGHGGRLDLAETKENLTRFEAGFWQEGASTKKVRSEA